MTCKFIILIFQKSRFTVFIAWFMVKLRRLTAVGQIFQELIQTVAVWLMGVSMDITDIYDPISGSDRGGHRDRVGMLKCSYQRQSLPRHGCGGDGAVCATNLQIETHSNTRTKTEVWTYHYQPWLGARQGVEANPKPERKTQFCHIGAEVIFPSRKKK